MVSLRSGEDSAEDLVLDDFRIEEKGATAWSAQRHGAEAVEQQDRDEMPEIYVPSRADREVMKARMSDKKHRTTPWENAKARYAASGRATADHGGSARPWSHIDLGIVRWRGRHDRESNPRRTSSRR